MDDTLIERLEAASEGSRELDEAIIDHFGWRNDFGTPIPPGFIGIPLYTSSIDHALKLKPEGWSWSIGDLRGYDPPIWRAHLRDHRPQSLTEAGHSHIWVEGNTPSGPALALCIAALKALRAQAGEKS